jgi:alcohol dehydrogenase
MYTHIMARASPGPALVAGQGENMQSLVYAEPGRVEWREARAPRLQGDLEALVAPVAASRCDFDREVVRGKTPLRGPFAIGHEAVAQVVEVGDAVGSVVPGDLAVVLWHVACGQCDRCRRGVTGHCRQTLPGSSYGIGPAWGGLFDGLVRVPYADAMLTCVPPGVDPKDVTAAGDSLGLGHAIITRAMRAGARRVAVFGRGEHGLYQVAFAVGLGAGSVLYVDQDSGRRALASGLGADAVAGPDQADGSFDVIVDAAGNEAWLRQAVAILEPEGVIECLGGYFGDIRLPGFQMYEAGVNIRFGLGNNGPHVQPTVEAVAAGMVHPSALWAAQVGWDDLPAAYLDEPRKLIAVRPAG